MAVVMTRRFETSRPLTLFPAGQCLLLPARRRCEPLSRSAPDLRHRPARPHEARVVDLVLELLVPNGEADQIDEILVGRAVAERLLQIPLTPGEQARAQL